jgi:hypothetical protein
MCAHTCPHDAHSTYVKLVRPVPTPYPFPTTQDALAYQGRAPGAHAAFAERLVKEALALNKCLTARPPCPPASLPAVASEVPALRTRWEALSKMLRPLTMTPEAMMARTSGKEDGGRSGGGDSEAPLPPVNNDDGRWERTLRIFERAEEIFKSSGSEDARALMQAIADRIYCKSFDYTGDYAFGAASGGSSTMLTVPAGSMLRQRGCAHEAYLDALAGRSQGVQTRQVVVIGRGKKGDTGPPPEWWVFGGGGWVGLERPAAA